MVIDDDLWIDLCEIAAVYLLPHASDDRRYCVMLKNGHYFSITTAQKEIIFRRKDEEHDAMQKLIRQFARQMAEKGVE